MAAATAAYPSSLPDHPAHIFDFTPDTLADWCSSRGMAPFRAKQILEWVYAKGIADPALMTNLSAADRALLAHPREGLTLLTGQTVRHAKASDGTQKLLIQWDEVGARHEGTEPRSHEGDDQTRDEGRAAPTHALPVLHASPATSTPDFDPRRQTECVMIPADYDEDLDGGRGDFKRKTACISSQVGCPVGCKFCASGIGGLDGNLSAGRIVEQVWRLARMLDLPGQPGSGRISNVVFMGMGEPLSNFANVVHAVRTMAAPWGLGISARKLTISTVGLPKAIERLARELDLPVTLALSLHAPNDALRRELIPWAEYTTIPDLLTACQMWFDKTGREITLEYILLRGVNDRAEHARELAAVARTLRANVNLIRYNEVKGMPFNRPTDADVRVFQDILRDAHVNVHIRASRGRDIAAACGQLRHEKSAAASVS